MRIAILAAFLVACGAPRASHPPTTLGNRATHHGPPRHAAVPPAATSPGKPTPGKATPPITAASLLTEDMVRALAGYQGELAIETMGESSNLYDDVHYRAAGEPEEFDVAARVWVVDVATAKANFDQMRADLPGARDLAGLGDRAMTASEGSIFGVVFMDNRGLVVLVSCGQAQCHSAADTVALVRRVHDRIPASW